MEKYKKQPVVWDTKDPKLEPTTQCQAGPYVLSNSCPFPTTRSQTQAVGLPCNQPPRFIPRTVANSKRTHEFSPSLTHLISRLPSSVKLTQSSFLIAAATHPPHEDVLRSMNHISFLLPNPLDFEPDLQWQKKAIFTISSYLSLHQCSVFNSPPSSSPEAQQSRPVLHLKHNQRMASLNENVIGVDSGNAEELSPAAPYVGRSECPGMAHQWKTNQVANWSVVLFPVVACCAETRCWLQDNVMNDPTKLNVI
ncbi:hypothetical protein Droror1_Dr00015822 [Drosera rotundifolia]